MAIFKKFSLRSHSSSSQIVEVKATLIYKSKIFTIKMYTKRKYTQFSQK